MPYLDNEEKFYDYKTSEVDGDDIFDLNKASNSWSQNFLDDPAYMLKANNMEMNIEHMSPREYWISCARDVFKKPVDQLLNQWRTLDYKTLDHLTQVILKYKKRFPITYINYAEHNHPTQEGLHRMIVAGDLFGWDTKFPVMIIKWADEEKAAAEKENRYIRKIENYIHNAIRDALRYKYYNLAELKDQLYSEIEDEVRFVDEFEGKEFNLDLEHNNDNEIIVTVNDKYKGLIYMDDIMFIDERQIEDDIDDLDLDDLSDWMKDLLSDLDKSKLKEAYAHTNEFLVSKDLINDLKTKFGETYYQSDKCKEICKYVKEQCPKCTLHDFAVAVWKLTSGQSFEEVLQGNYAVITFENKVYDYTSGRFDSYNFADPGTPVKVIPRNDKLSERFKVDIYTLKDYIIIVHI